MSWPVVPWLFSVSACDFANPIDEFTYISLSFWNGSHKTADFISRDFNFTVAMKAITISIDTFATDTNTVHQPIVVNEE